MRKKHLYYQLAEILAVAELSEVLKAPQTGQINSYIAQRAQELRKKIGKKYDVKKFIKASKDL